MIGISANVKIVGIIGIPRLKVLDVLMIVKGFISSIYCSRPEKRSAFAVIYKSDEVRLNTVTCVWQLESFRMLCYQPAIGCCCKEDVDMRMFNWLVALLSAVRYSCIRLRFCIMSARIMVFSSTPVESLSIQKPFDNFLHHLPPLREKRKIQSSQLLHGFCICRRGNHHRRRMYGNWKQSVPNIHQNAGRVHLPRGIHHSCPTADFIPNSQTCI